MDKQQKNSGFTMIEMMFTMFIVSIILTITITSLPKYNYGDVDDEIINIEYFFQNAQFRAKNLEEIQYIRINYYDNNLLARGSESGEEIIYSLTSCQLQEGGMTNFHYFKDGDTSHFGTINVKCGENIVKFIFQIQKGRFRVER